MTGSRTILAEETALRPATPVSLSSLHAAMDSFWSVVETVLGKPLDMRWRLEFITAVAEVAANIIQHAYQDSAGEGSLSLRLRLYADRVEAQFTDWGARFDEASAPQPAPSGPDPFEVPETGHGLNIARAAVDVLQYRRLSGARNQWRLVKRFGRKAFREVESLRSRT